MKRLLIFITMLLCVLANAQNINDVLRYGSENTQGTARYQSMSGAFGALGGDMSALNINPAGSAVFANSLITFSGTNYHRHNDAAYSGQRTVHAENDLDLNQFGGVFVFRNTNSDSNWNKFSMAFNYDLAQNFDNQFYGRGNSNQGIDQYYLSYAQGVPFGTILIQDGEYLEDAYLDIGANQGFKAQQAFLGYYGGFIDPVSMDDTNTSYVSNASYTQVNHDYYRSTRGYNSKLTFNMASQFREDLYLGASLNFHNIFYEQYGQLTERGYSTASAIQESTLDNFLRTEGTAFSFSLGAIAKVNDYVRVGGSYVSPTWYRLADDFSQRTSSDLEDEDMQYLGFDEINLFAPYRIKTPGKITGSLAFIFGSDGLISLDYGYQNFSQSELRPVSDSNFQVINRQIADQLGSVSSFRLGGEYRIKAVSLRGGYRFEQSPFSRGDYKGDLNGYSGGIGYDFGGSRLDFALNRLVQDTNEYVADAGITTPIIVSRTNTNATLSFTINF